MIDVTRRHPVGATVEIIRSDEGEMHGGNKRPIV